MPQMFMVTEENAAAIRAAFDQDGELSAVVELRRRFPGITDNAHARTCVRSIAGGTPLPPAPCTVTRLHASDRKERNSPCDELGIDGGQRLRVTARSHFLVSCFEYDKHVIEHNRAAGLGKKIGPPGKARRNEDPATKKAKTITQWTGNVCRPQSIFRSEKSQAADDVADPERDERRAERLLADKGFDFT